MAVCDREGSVVLVERQIRDGQGQLVIGDDGRRQCHGYQSCTQAMWPAGELASRCCPTAHHFHMHMCQRERGGVVAAVSGKETKEKINMGL